MKTPQERCAELVASHQCSYRAAFHELVLVMAEKGCLPETKDMPPVVRGIWEASEKEAEENRFRREAVAKLKAALTAEELKALGWDGSEF